MKKAIINWGIIGCGEVTEIKSGPCYYKVEGFNLQGVTRRNISKATDYAKRHHVKNVYATASELIKDPEIDAVYIATPPDSHYKYALEVAREGKPCCIEKPLAPSYSESLTIISAFKSSKTPLFVAYYRRSLPRFLKIKEWIDNNYIGNLRQITWTLTKTPSAVDLSKEHNWRTDAKIAPGGYFDDLASHGIDLFTFLLGDIKAVNGFGINQQNLYSSKDAFCASWIHQNKILGSATWNFGTFKNEDSVKILGSSGEISFSIFDENPVQIESESKTESLFIEHPEHVQEPHVRNIKEYLSGNLSEHPSNGDSALHTSWVMDYILNAK